MRLSPPFAKGGELCASLTTDRPCGEKAEMCELDKHRDIIG